MLNNHTQSIDYLSSIELNKFNLLSNYTQSYGFYSPIKTNDITTLSNHTESYEYYSPVKTNDISTLIYHTQSYEFYKPIKINEINSVGTSSLSYYEMPTGSFQFKKDYFAKFEPENKNQGTNFSDYWYFSGEPTQWRRTNKTHMNFSSKVNNRHVNVVIGDNPEMMDHWVTVSQSKSRVRLSDNLSGEQIYTWGDWIPNPTDTKQFRGRKYAYSDDSKYKARYISYFETGSGGDNKRDGLFLGMTTYVSESSTGELIYPRNHYREFHLVKDQLRHAYWTKKRGDSPLLGDGPPDFGPDLDPQPDKWVYSLKVESSDTKNVLEVKRNNRRKNQKP